MRWRACAFWSWPNTSATRPTGPRCAVGHLVISTSTISPGSAEDDCPAGTQPYAGACFESASRAGQTWLPVVQRSHAVEQVGDDGRAGCGRSTRWPCWPGPGKKHSNSPPVPSNWPSHCNTVWSCRSLIGGQFLVGHSVIYLPLNVTGRIIIQITKSVLLSQKQRSRLEPASFIYFFIPYSLFFSFGSFGALAFLTLIVSRSPLPS
mgnify:CR=1 FL=1